jgi:hypothetical protein
MGASYFLKRGATLANFVQYEMQVVNIGDAIYFNKGGDRMPSHHIPNEHYEPYAVISNTEMIKIDSDFTFLPKNHWHPYLSLVIRRNGKVYCNGRVWNAKKKAWQFSIKAYCYYIFRNRSKHYI